MKPNLIRVLYHAVRRRDGRTLVAILFPFYVGYLGIHARQLYRYSPLYRNRMEHFEQGFVESMFLEDSTWQHFLWRARRESPAFKSKLFLCGLLQLPLPVYDYSQDV